MKLLIVGSRNISDFDLSEHVPPETELIISGGARGVDTLAEEYADSHGIPKLIILPDYKRYGRSAPMRRNDEMIEHADEVLVIWDGKSRGTDYTARRARASGKSVRTVLVP